MQHFCGDGWPDLGEILLSWPGLERNSSISRPPIRTPACSPLEKSPTLPLVSWEFYESLCKTTAVTGIEFIQFRFMSHASTGHEWWPPGFGPLLSLRSFLRCHGVLFLVNSDACARSLVLPSRIKISCVARLCDSVPERRYRAATNRSSRPIRVRGFKHFACKLSLHKVEGSSHEDSCLR